MKTRALVGAGLWKTPRSEQDRMGLGAMRQRQHRIMQGTRAPATPRRPYILLLVKGSEHGQCTKRRNRFLR